MCIQPSIAAVVDNNISGSNIKQYYFFDCEQFDCQVIYREIVGTEEPSPIVAIPSVDNPTAGEAGVEESVLPTDASEVVSIVDSVVPTDVAIVSETTSVPEVIYDPQSIRINEVVSAAETGEKEWVELYNTLDEVVSLDAWFIEEGAETKTVLSGQIEPRGYLVFETKNLNNSGDLIMLKDPKGQIIDQVVYGDWDDGNSLDNCPVTDKGESLALYEGEYVANSQITKGSQNIYDRLEISPTIQVETTSTVETQVITQAQEPSQPTAGADPELVLTPAPITYQYSDQVKLSEFLPAPADGIEWIELYNGGAVDVDLDGWSLDDADGGSSPYRIADSLIVKAGSYLDLSQTTTKIQLNNSGDEVRLIDPSGQVVDSVTYTASHENMSWAKVSGNWVETNFVTPELANAVATVAESTVSTTVVSPETINTVDPMYPYKKIIDLAVLDLRSQIMIQGSVTVLPGTFSKNVIYVQDETGGVQVYFDAATWPQLEIGRKVMLSGTLSQSLGEKRVLLKNASDMMVLEGVQEVEPVKVTTAEFKSNLVGSLVELEATLFEKDASSWFLTDAYGGAKAYIKRGTQISTSLFNTNDKLKITGVLVQNSSETLLQPRAESDISEIKTEPDAVGVTSAGAMESLPPSNQGEYIKMGIVASAVILGVINGVLLVRKYLSKRKIKGIWYRFKTGLQN